MKIINRDGMWAKYEIDLRYFSIFLFIINGRMITIRWWGQPA